MKVDPMLMKKWSPSHTISDLCNVLQNVLRDDVLVAQKYFALQNKTKNLAVMSGKQSKNQQKYHHPQ